MADLKKRKHEAESKAYKKNVEYQKHLADKKRAKQLNPKNPDHYKNVVIPTTYQFQNGEKADPWQKKVLDHEGNIALRCGRQTGKSRTISEKVFRLAITHPNTRSLVIAASQRQSSLIFEKINAIIRDEHIKLVEREKKLFHNKIDKLPKEQKPTYTEIRQKYYEIEYTKGLYSSRPTQTKIELTNGSIIYCLPTGQTGDYIRGYTIDFLVADEAAYIPQAVWTAVKPMIAVSRETRGLGYEIYLSTPLGKGSYFYEVCNDPKFLNIHVSSESCPRIPKDFLRKERQRLSKREYAQEYLAEFVEGHSQYFATEIIQNQIKHLRYKYREEYSKGKYNYFLGVDFARMGGDENAFAIAEQDKRTKKARIIKIQTHTQQRLTKTVREIQKLEELWNFNKIYVDDGGVGGGATDQLQELLGKKKVIALNNSSKSEIKNTAGTGRILKEDLYSHTLLLLENETLELISEPKLTQSLMSVQYKYSQAGNLLIYGNYTHVTEALVRAVWGLKEKKTGGLWIR